MYLDILPKISLKGLSENSSRNFSGNFSMDFFKNFSKDLCGHSRKDSSNFFWIAPETLPKIPPEFLLRFPLVISLGISPSLIHIQIHYIIPPAIDYGIPSGIHLGAPKGIR